MTSKHEKSPFLKMAYLTIHENSSRRFSDYDFFLLLEGSIRILKDQETYFLGKDDVFLFEPGCQYQVSSAGNNVVLSVILDSAFFKRGHSLQTGHFICNSSVDSARNYQPLRQLLTQSAYIYFGNEDILGLNLTAQAYRLLYYLNAYHYEGLMEEPALPFDNPKYRERMTAVLNYIHENYASSVSLQEAANALHLSVPYLSAFFKQNMKENFNRYVNRIRLQYAVEELIYTEKSITAITFDNGFASMNAFNRIFKEVYHTTPNRYRRAQKAERAFISQPLLNAVQELPTESYQQLLASYGAPEHLLLSQVQFPSQEVVKVKDMRSAIPTPPIWKMLLNLGPLSQLLKRDMEKQLNQVTDTMAFTYGRIEKVMNYSLFKKDNNSYFFMDFDRAINSLQVHNLIPYLELSLPHELLETTETGKIIVDQEQYLSLLEAMLTHSANMYGMDEVDSWYFEVNPQQLLSQRYFEPAESFIPRFIAAYRLIRKFFPNAKIGGLLLDGLLPDKNVLEMLTLLKPSGIIPDFLCIGIFPYEELPSYYDPDARVTRTTGRLFYTRDKSYAKHRVQAFRQALTPFFAKLPPIHLSYLSCDIFHGQYLSDTCYQSAFFFHNTVDLIGEVDMLGYYQMSDIPSMADSNGAFMDGCNGLFNKYGIRKPGSILLSIFSKCRNYLVQKGEDFIILKGSVDRYMIGMCNYTYVSEYNGYTLHNQIPPEDAYKIFESPKTKNIELELHNMAEGTYQIILYQINRKHGSAFDEWARNGYPEWLSKDDLDYLRSTIQPLRTLYQKSTCDGSMQFRFHLEPHEVVFLALLMSL